jgi:hypothetical protein
LEEELFGGTALEEELFEGRALWRKSSLEEELFGGKLFGLVHSCCAFFTQPATSSRRNPTHERRKEESSFSLACRNSIVLRILSIRRTILPYPIMVKYKKLKTLI